MLAILKRAALLLLIMTIMTGMLYPLFITAVSQLAFPDQANGSLAVVNGQIAGSWLIGQPFSQPQYFHGRPSAAMVQDDITISGASNYGPTSLKWLDAVGARIAAIRLENQLPAAAPVPSDLVTASASGLDPHISPASAELQVNRVAAARSLEPDRLRQLIAECTENPTIGIWGESRVNVLLLNTRLDALH